MAIAIPRAFQNMWDDNEKRLFGTAMQKRKGLSTCLDSYYLEEKEKEKVFRLQQELQKRKEEEEYKRCLRKRMDSPAMQCTVTDGVNLWIAKFGDGWVDRGHMVAVSDPEGLEWSVLADRLRKLNMMEELDVFVRIRT